MKTIQCRKLFARAICVALILFSACKDKQREQQQTSASATASEHPHADSALKDNEVKSEAPDAGSKTEQGYALPRQSAQMAQSPINIISVKAEKDTKQQFLFAFHSDCDAVENLGHTIQVDFKKGSTCTINGKDFTSKQFHFHTPSEHLIDGVTYPLEMHIVNMRIDSSNPEKPSYVVLSVMFKMGAENKFLKEFLNDIPNEEGEKQALRGGEVRLDDLLSQFVANDMESYYAYSGSLTTPPFTEGVQWVILKHMVEASEEQITKIEKMEGNNARHVQAVNGRKIFSQ
jgi:carbonic anhydrase